MTFRNLIADIEEQIDWFDLGFSLAGYLYYVGPITKEEWEDIYTFYEPQWNDIFDVDEQMLEAYGKSLFAYQSFWQRFKEDLHKYLVNFDND